MTITIPCPISHILRLSSRPTTNELRRDVLSRPWAALLRPKLSNLPLRIPTRLSDRYILSIFHLPLRSLTLTLLRRLVTSFIQIDVATPSDFGLPYEELKLDTPDRVKVRAYLLTQRRELAVGDAVVHADHGASYMSDDEVCGLLLDFEPA